MKIIAKNTGLIALEYAKRGEVVVWSGEHYIVTKEFNLGSVTCVALKDGNLKRMRDDTMVRPVDAEVVLK